MKRVYITIEKKGTVKTVDFVINEDDTVRYWRYWLRYNGWNILKWWVA